MTFRREDDPSCCSLCGRPGCVRGSGIMRRKWLLQSFCEARGIDQGGVIAERIADLDAGATAEINECDSIHYEIYRRSDVSRRPPV